MLKTVYCSEFFYFFKQMKIVHETEYLSKL